MNIAPAILPDPADTATNLADISATAVVVAIGQPGPVGHSVWLYQRTGSVQGELAV